MSSVVNEILREVTADESIARAMGDVRAGREATLFGLACSAKAVTLARLHRDGGKPMLVVLEKREDAEALLGDLEVCLGEERVFFFPETEVLPYDHRSPHVGLSGERIPTLAALRAGEHVVVVTTARALGGRLVSPDAFDTFSIPLAVGDAMDRDDLAEALVARGFHPERLVEEVGTFAVRGGLVDFFPFGTEHPLRVEFFGDEIESIRRFDPATQRTVDSVSALHVLPQREILLSEETVRAAFGRGDLPFDEGAAAFVDGIEAYLPRFHPGVVSLLAYFPPGGIVVLDEPERVRECVDEQRAAADGAFAELRSRGHRPVEPAGLT
ncbi:hypothetical protein K8I85_01870, partial [bacterium]|nr:hypothetical protein [bacterium]